MYLVVRTSSASGRPGAPNTPLAPALVEAWPISVFVTNLPAVISHVVPSDVSCARVVPLPFDHSPDTVSVPAPVFVTVFVPSKLWKAASLPSVRSDCVSIVKLRDVVTPHSVVCARVWTDQTPPSSWLISIL